MKISVALAAYNGEKYIAEQLQSILSQTVPPDEIIISDDGSTDKTIERIREVLNTCGQSGKNAAEVILLQDNPKHGFIGNFEHAIKHCTGDVIFLCDQDDVWMPDKVEKVCAFSAGHPDALLVIHDASLIDGDGAPLDGSFNPVFRKLILEECAGRDCCKLPKDKFLSHTIEFTISMGMVMCIRKELVPIALPFPTGHDVWLGFCAVAMDKCWYINSVLGYYRQHGGNLTGHYANKGSLSERLKRLDFSPESVCKTQKTLALLDAFTAFLNKHGITDESYCKTQEEIRCVLQKKEEAAKASGISAVLKLLHLYRTNERYRGTGRQAFLLECLSMLINSRKTRLKALADNQ